MMVKSAVLAFAGALSLGASDAPVLTTSHPYVHQVICAGARGTAFQINSNTALTAAHVSSIGGCKINGMPVEVVETDPSGDFAILRYHWFPRSRGLRLSCEGYRNGQVYVGIGFAKGLPIQRALAGQYLTTLPKAKLEWATLFTPVPFIPGMSGGPVFNGRGEVVGVVNAYSPFFPLSFSRSLSDTSLCSRKVVR
jgi:hypothetical protein